MKKLFLSLLALVAMVVTANAQRAWAYDLSLTSESESYTFTFKATTAATATLILSDEEGNNVGTLDLGAVVAGSNTFTYTTDQLPKAGKMNWAVKLTGGAVVEEVALKELNSTLFYNMMGIVADVNPESDHFGKVYMQMSYDGKPTYGTTKQTQGFFIFDPIFNLISTPNIGIKPTLPSGYTLDGTNRLQFHRVAIDPKTGDLAFCYSIANKPGVFSISRNNLTGEVTNLLAGVTGVENIKRTNALCFDKDGALYIIADVTTASTTGNIYKILDGVATKLTLKGKKIWIDEQVGLVSDGRGGLWVAQNRSGITANSAVFHVNIAKDTIDFVLETDKDYSDWFAGGNGNNCRGGIAYNVKENILATHSQNAKVSLFKVTYDEETGIPTITKWLQGATGGKNTDAIAFDYAGDLYTGNSSGEYFKKFAVPTSDNTCTTPAPKAQVVINTDQTVYAVTTVVNEEAMGTVTGAGNYLAGESATLTATANAGYRFVNWTVGEETLAENPLTLIVNSDLTVTANFEAIPTYTITASVNDENMGAVEGAGTYYEGEEVSLTATPKAGHAFVSWSNDATDNPLVFTATEDVEVTANFEILSYTITVLANDEAKGSVIGAGTYEYGTEVTLTATANEGYEFVNWSNGSKANPLTITVKEDTELTANFRQVLATSITLNALPVQDYSATIVGTLKRALQNGENTIVLTHEANGTPHIYNVAHATNTVTEISQEGVVAVDSENAGDYLAISDIALTEDGKLVATNKIVCQTEGYVDDGYKRGELRAYIWNDLAGAPSLWFTSKMSSNWFRAVQGHTIAYKGTSTNGTLFTTGVTATGVKFRYSVYNVIDGVYTDPAVNNSDYYHFTKGSAQTTDALGANYQLVASPLASPNWILDGELVEPFEIVDPLTFNTEVTANPTLSVNLGKKYNGASCLANYNEHHLFLAPYANEEGYLAGVKVVDVVDGFAAATELTTNTDLATAENATAAAATAVVDAEGKLTIHLFADARVYTFTEKAVDPTPPEVELVGVVKRALTIGESTVVLTHEADGTPHIYNIVGEEIAEISQEGVIARDPENAGDLLAISDIAATEDGKLVAVNYMICQSDESYVDEGYKRGENRFYIWNSLTEDPTVWFTSNKYSNWFRAKQGYSIALRGTSQNAEILLTGLHATKYWARYTCYKVVDGAYTEDYWFEGTLAGTLDENKCGSAYELNASPLNAANWIMDGELVDPIEYLNAEANAGKMDFYPELVSLSIDLGKKFNGVTYLTIGAQAIMVAPYADAEGKLAGVKVLDITAGLDKATELKVANLDAAVEATAAATAVAVADNVLTITLVADATLHVLEVELEKGPATALENIAVEGKAIKMIKNGQLIIIKNGIQYNVQGAVVK